MKKKFLVVLGVMFLLAPLSAMATPSGSGGAGGFWQEENFSISWDNFDPSLAGQSFDWHDYDDAGWMYGDQSINLEMNSTIENMLSADFSIILGGAGYLQPAEINLNGFSLGQATVGDGSMIGVNIYELDVFPLDTPMVSSLGAMNTLQVGTMSGDGYVFIGANLSGTHNVWHGSSGGGTAPVPEPATMLLFGTGLAGLTAFRKKNKK